MVEVADQLWVDGATELGHLSVGRGDEDPLDCFHQDVVEQRVLGAGRQSVTNKVMDRQKDGLHPGHQQMELGSRQSEASCHSLHGVVHSLALLFCEGLLQAAQVKWVGLFQLRNLSQRTNRSLPYQIVQPLTHKSKEQHGR